MQIAINFARKHPSACAAAIGLFMIAPGVQAAPVLLSDNNVAIGILNLEVGGTLYNVDFEFDQWPDIYGSPTPVFDFTGDLAQEANEKVNAVLNGANTTGEKVKQVGPPQEGASNEGFPLYAIGVSYGDVNTPYVDWIGAAFIDNLDLWADDFLGIPLNGAQTADSTWMWANFSEVPVPAAVWLFGSGLLGLIGVARRKQAPAFRR
jgi:hypothetical protein